MTAAPRDKFDEGYRRSARLNGLRSAQLQQENLELKRQLRMMQASLAWRVTFPLRAVRALTLGKRPNGHPIRTLPASLRRALTADRIHSRMQMIVHRVQRVLRRWSDRPGAKADVSLYSQPSPATYAELSPRIVIIAELTLRQCAKYRVWQKRELLESLGWSVEVVDWRNLADARAALQLCTQVIFYRVPGFDDVLALVEEAHRLKLAPRWEVDDLIFDEDEYRQNGNVSSLSVAERELLLWGVGLFRRCMLACGNGIASTSSLARAMRNAGLDDVAVIENALDAQTLQIAAELPPRRLEDRVWVSYGSGTNTHDADFREAEEGLLAAMEDEPRLALKVIGQLRLCPAFETFGDRVERLTELSYADYLVALSQTDIAIAPLEPTLFNDCKSNIKYLEASVAGVASICSPRAAFLTILRHNQNGLAADGPAAWREGFLRLARDGALRERLARSARADVLARYAPEVIAQTQGEALFGRPERPQGGALRLLMANVYFAPQSFGGATIVAEELGRRLVDRGVRVSVMTTRAGVDGRVGTDARYDVGGMHVFAWGVGEENGTLAQIDNPAMADRFGEMIDACRPDVVHMHAAQGLGTGILRICQERGIPYVLTLHDAWWLCERQFMVRADGRYCFQTRIDPKVCRMCVPGAKHLDDREALMYQGLEGATALISPSEAHRALYVANGVPPEKIVVQRNGFRWPRRMRAARKSGTPLRFGFVGGTEAVKGYGLLKAAMQSLDRGDWELCLVDNKINLGFRSIFPEDWSVRGRLKIVPAYTQDGLDDFYDQIDVLLFPSQWKESYGLTVREALARDVWVVVTAPGGQSEDVTDGVNGTYLPLDGKPETLSAIVETLLDEPERFEGYVNPFKQDLATYDTQTDQLYSLLKQVASEHQNPDVRATG